MKPIAPHFAPETPFTLPGDAIKERAELRNAIDGFNRSVADLSESDDCELLKAEIVIREHCQKFLTRLVKKWLPKGMFNDYAATMDRNVAAIELARNRIAQLNRPQRLPPENSRQSKPLFPNDRQKLEWSDGDDVDYRPTPAAGSPSQGVSHVENDDVDDPISAVQRLDLVRDTMSMRRACQISRAPVTARPGPVLLSRLIPG